MQLLEQNKPENVNIAATLSFAEKFGPEVSEYAKQVVGWCSDAFYLVYTYIYEPLIIFDISQ